MKRIAIIGAGELGRQIAHLGEKNGLNIVGFFDDSMISGTVMGLPVFGKIASISESEACFDALVMGVGYNHFVFRKTEFELLKQKYDFATIIDETSNVDPTASLGVGCVVYPNVCLDKDVQIGDNVLLNMSCNVCHNSIICSHSYISPAASIAGFVSVGTMTFVGLGAVVSDHIQIADSTTIGAGAVVVKNIMEPNGVYVGNPAKFLKIRQ